MGELRRREAHFTHIQDTNWASARPSKRAWRLLARTQLWSWREIQLQMSVTWATAGLDSHIINLSLNMNSDLYPGKTIEVSGSLSCSQCWHCSHNPTPLFWTISSELKPTFIINIYDVARKHISYLFVYCYQFSTTAKKESVSECIL